MVDYYVRLEEKERKRLGRNLYVKEYNALMEKAGCPKIWIVETNIGHNIYTSAYLSEGEAMEEYNSIPNGKFKEIHKVWDIWGYTDRLKNKK